VLLGLLSVEEASVRLFSYTPLPPGWRFQGRPDGTIFLVTRKSVFRRDRGPFLGVYHVTWYYGKKISVAGNFLSYMGR